MNRFIEWKMTAVIVTASAVLCASTGAASPKLPAKSSWIGNSFPGGEKWVQQDIAAMWVDADGTIYTNVEWDEAGREVGVYRDGDVIGKGGYTHGWGNHGGRAIAANSRYVFVGCSMTNERGGLKDPGTWPPKGSTWLGVSRRLKSDVSKGAPFPGGKGGKGATLKESFLVVSEVSDQSKEAITGLCANETHLCVSDAKDGRIRVFLTETMQPVLDFPCERPGPLAFDAKGNLWVLQTGEHPALRIFNSAGDSVTPTIEFPAGVRPTAFCFDPSGRLLVADAGEAEQILVYENPTTTPKLSATIGEKGGIFGGMAGTIGPMRFHQLAAIGTDAKGNIYVAHDGQSGGGGTVLESYASDKLLKWQLFGLEFVDMADVDPARESDVFTKEERFHDGAYAGFTIHPRKYPQDPRLHIWSAGAWVRRLAGQRILFVNDMNGDHLQVYRFSPDTDGEIAIPSGFFAKKTVKTKTRDWPPHQPAEGEWIWRDTNGNGAFDADEFSSQSADAPSAQGWWVDGAGNVWLATEKQGIRFLPSGGLDARGNPQWDYAKMRTFPAPAEFDQIKRLRYDAERDVMILGGTKGPDKNQHWKPMGPVIASYDGWLKGDAKLRWRIVAPYATGAKGHESCEPMGFDAAGDYVFVPYTGASKELGFATGHVEVFTLKDGSPAGHFEPSPEMGEIGLQDIRECLRAHRRADGEYQVFLEDDAKAKVMMFRWKP